MKYEDPSIRLSAALALNAMNWHEGSDMLASLLADNDEIEYYNFDTGELVRTQVNIILEQVCIVNDS